jgi:hypothetical protein
MKRAQSVLRYLSVVGVAVLTLGGLFATAPARAETRAIEFPAAFQPHPLNDVVASQTAPVAFVGSRETDTLFAFDPRTGIEIGRVAIGDGPIHVAIFEEAGRRLLAVSCDGFLGVPDNYVAFVDATDPAAMRVTGRATLPKDYIFLFDPGTVRFVADGRAIVLAATHSQTTRGLFAAFDVASGAELAELPLTYVPSSLDVVEANGKRTVAISHAVAPRGRVSIVDASDLSHPAVAAIAKFPKKSGLFNINNVALTPDGRVGFIATGQANALFAFETATGRVLSKSVTRSFPTYVRMTEIGGVVSLALVAENSATVSLYDVSDPASLRLTSYYESPAVFLDVAPGLSPDGTTLYTASTANNRVYAVDLATGTLRYQTLSGDYPSAFAVWDGDGESFVSVVGARAGDVTTFRDTAAGVGAKRFASRSDAVNFSIYQNVVVSGDGRFAFAASKLTNELLAIDLDAGALVARVPVGLAPSRVALGEDTAGVRRVAVLGAGDSSFTIVDATEPHAMHESARIDLASPFAYLLEFATIAISADGVTAFVADGNQFVHAVDLARGEILSTVGSGFNPVTLALYETRGRRTLGVLNASGNAPSVAIVDATNPAAMTRTAVAELPEGLVVALNNIPQFTTDGKFVVAGASISGLAFTIDVATGAISGSIESSATNPAPFADGATQMFVAANLGDETSAIYRLKKKGAPRVAHPFEALPGSFFLVGNDPLVAPDGSWGYVPNYGRTSLLSFDPRTGVVVGELPLGLGPGAAAIERASGRVVALEVNGTASRLLVANLADLQAPSSAETPRRAARAGASGAIQAGGVVRGVAPAALDTERGRIVRWDRASRPR